MVRQTGFCGVKGSYDITILRKRRGWYEDASEEEPRHQVIKTPQTLGGSPTHKLPLIGWLKLALICDWSKHQKLSRHPKLVAMALFARTTACTRTRKAEVILLVFFI